MLQVPAMAAPLLQRFVATVGSAAPAVLQRIAQRIGTSPTVAAIVNTVKNNYIMLAYAAYELFGAEDTEVKAALEAPALASVKEALIRSLEYKPEYNISNVDTLDDEFALIEEAARNLGGVDALVMLRNALRLPDDVFQKHRALTRMGYRR